MCTFQALWPIAITGHHFYRFSPTPNLLPRQEGASLSGGDSHINKTGRGGGGGGLVVPFRG